MAETQRERETKFDVAADFAVPDLGEPADVRRSTVQLTSTYFDTSDLALLTHRVTLRRRTGDADTGWHLKVPSGDARTEIRLPLEAGGDELSADSIPAKLTELTVGLAHGAALAPVAEIATRRERYQLMDGTEVLAEIADDHVRATAFGPAVRMMEWREVEIELGTGDEALLARLGERLEAAGAVPATTPSKLARVLARGELEVADAVRPLHEYLVEQLRVLGAGDVALRRGLDPIHKTRVAARRFRSVLRVFADVLDEARASALDHELSWYQDLLGEVRDRQVQRARFAAAIDALPPEMVLGPVAGDIDSTLLSDQLAAAERLTAALSSERYLKLMGEVLAWTTALPARPGVRSDDVVAAARSARKKAAKRLRQAVRADRPELLHRARKAIKRARYATELTDGKSAKKVKRYKRLQDVLGEHQDCAIAAELLHRLGAATAAEPGRNGFTYGVLWQREQVLAAEARKRAAKLTL